MLLEHLFTAFLQRRAAALLLYEGTHRLDVLQHRIEFENHALPQFLPTD